MQGETPISVRALSSDDLKKLYLNAHLSTGTQKVQKVACYVYIVDMWINLF